MVDRVQDVVDKYKELSRVYWLNFNEVAFKDDEDKQALEMLSGLSADEFEQFFNRLDEKERKKLPLTADENLKNDPKYKDIVYALNSGDPKAYVNKKRQQEQTDEQPKFDDYGYEKFKKEEAHSLYVDLYIPKGASPQLISLIEDMEFTMQGGFDTLADGTPKNAPDFSAVLEGAQVDTMDGWSKIRESHDELKDQLTARRAKYIADHKDVKGATYDSAITGSDTFKHLKLIMDELNSCLEREPSGLSRTGYQITESSGGPPTSAMDVPVYEKNTDGKNGQNGMWYLSPHAEQRYYVSAIDTASEKWEETYREAVNKYQKQAEIVDMTSVGDQVDTHVAKKQVDFVEPLQPRAAETAGQMTSTPKADLSPTQSGWPASSLDTADSLNDTEAGTEKISNTGSTDMSSSGVGSPYTARSPMRDNFDTGTPARGGSATTGISGNNATPAASSSGSGAAEAMQQVAMMSALNGMMGRESGQPHGAQSYDRGDRDRQEERVRRRENERDRNAPTAAATPAVPQTTPGVTAPTSAGTPPTVTKPGGMVDYKIGDSTVQVSRPVAEALLRQTQNTATDAAAAYAGTVGESSADHPWATVNDVAQLRTGDVVQWEKHSTLIIKNETGLNILDHGQLIPLDPNYPPLTDKYGGFTGYAHPTGLDIGLATDSAPPPPPKVSSAQPAGAPHVIPPQA
ncbi:hypothetical protein [Nocardia sp. NPDC004750]